MPEPAVHTKTAAARPRADLTALVARAAALEQGTAPPSGAGARPPRVPTSPLGAPLSAAPTVATIARPVTRPIGPSIAGWRTASPGGMLALMPGELWSGAEAASVKTLLGSCVALTLWHPSRRIGGMCHYLLPSRQRSAGEAPDGRYGDEAVAAMVQALERLGCASHDPVAHLYGGADTMGEIAGVRFNVGERNIEQGWALIERHGFTLEGVDVGDNVPRTVTLVPASGRVECRRGQA